MQIKDLKQDKRNYRKHNDRNLELIKKSVNEVGFGRSVVVDNENEIICGNGVVSTLDKNTPIKVIETDGSELVVVKRTDLSTEDKKRKQLAIMDNSTSDTSEFDYTLLQADFDVPDLKDMGIDIPEVEIEEPKSDKDDIVKELYDLRGLIYEKQGEKPKIEDLYEEKGIKEFEKEIEKSNATKEEKAFMRKALTRFYRFNFRNIAEYYCHSSDEVKELFAKLLLVIPDGKQLLKNELLGLDNIISGEFEDD